MLSTNIKVLLDNLNTGQTDLSSAGDQGPLISVNKLTGKAGAFYEKIRYLIEYRDDQTIRRSAIERILKRKLIIENEETIGLPLLEELVGAGYLFNKRVPEQLSVRIQAVVDKYRWISRKVDNTIVGIMATEIERLLYPQVLNEQIVGIFYQTVADYIKYAGRISEAELRTQIYLACRRSLLEEDPETLLYVRLTQYLPELLQTNDEQTWRGLSTRFNQALTSIKAELNHPFSRKVASKIKGYSIYFGVIRELIKIHGANTESLFEDWAKLEQEIKKLLEKKYAEIRTRVSRSGDRAVIYVILTKIILGVALELPIEKFLLNSTDYFALGVNLIFHPLLLLFMVKSAPFPDAQNTSLIISGVKAILLGADIKTIHIKDLDQHRSLYLVFTVLYGILFAITFGLILWGLRILHFNIVSMFVFMLFLTIISYFGLRVRYNAQEWKVPGEEEGGIALLSDFFTIPIINTGRWLSQRFSSINIFVFTLDFILETPFKFMLGTFDAFISYLKESKDHPL